MLHKRDEYDGCDRRDGEPDPGVSTALPESHGLSVRLSAGEPADEHNGPEGDEARED